MDFENIDEMTVTFDPALYARELADMEFEHVLVCEKCNNMLLFKEWFQFGNCPFCGVGIEDNDLPW